MVVEVEVVGTEAVEVMTKGDVVEDVAFVLALIVMVRIIQ